MRRVVVAVEELERPEALEAAVDEDIQAFEAWFSGLGNDPLTKGERAILKTYLWRKTRGASDGTTTGG
jgi:hypothetical protein